MSKVTGSWSEVYDGRASKTKEGYTRKHLHHDKSTTPSRIVTRRAHRALAAAKSRGEYKPVTTNKKSLDLSKFILDASGEQVSLDSPRGRFLASLAAARAPATAAMRAVDAVAEIKKRAAAVANTRAALLPIYTAAEAVATREAAKHRSAVLALRAAQKLFDIAVAAEAKKTTKTRKKAVVTKTTELASAQTREAQTQVASAAAEAARVAAKTALDAAPAPVATVVPPRGPGVLNTWEDEWIRKWNQALTEWRTAPTTAGLGVLSQLDREYVNRVEVTPSQRADQTRQQAETALETLLRDALGDFSVPPPVAPQDGDAPAIDSTKPEFLDFLQGFGSPETDPEGMAVLAACLSKTQLGRRFFRSYVFERNTLNPFDAAASTELDMSLRPTADNVRELWRCLNRAATSGGRSVNFGTITNRLSALVVAQGIAPRGFP